MSRIWNRRRVLRGMLGGSAVALSLPFLDCFLDGNGTALAATGAPLPVRFGTWLWGCGMNASLWVPTKTGAGYDLLPELKPIEPVRDLISILSGYRAILDGKGNISHVSGVVGLRTGTAPAADGKIDAPTFDVLISNAIGNSTRFRALDVACTGNPRISYSIAAGNVVNPAEVSPVSVYSRIFGPEFQDPNAADFRPDPKIMLRRSVLSGVAEERASFMRAVGASDRERLDQFFTSLRQLENQLELQLQKPPPADACRAVGAPAEKPVGSEIGQVMTTHALMAQLLAMALACNQTKVFNVVFSEPFSTLRKAGSSSTHHTLTHEEPIDPKLGYQVESSWFALKTMEGWATFVKTLADIREGEGTLLDNCMVVAHSDTQLAKVHSIDGIPAMVAGKAGGRLKTGLHINGNGEPITRIGYTAQQVMGVSVERWGTGSMQTSKPVTELLA
jgi:hypothetical protein